MGHLIRIGNYLIDPAKQGRNASKLEQLLQELPEELLQQWQGFVESTLAPAVRNSEIIPVTV